MEKITLAEQDDDFFYVYFKGKTDISNCFVRNEDEENKEKRPWPFSTLRKKKQNFDGYIPTFTLGTLIEEDNIASMQSPLRFGLGGFTSNSFGEETIQTLVKSL